MTKSNPLGQPGKHRFFHGPSWTSSRATEFDEITWMFIFMALSNARHTKERRQILALQLDIPSLNSILNKVMQWPEDHVLWAIYSARMSQALVADSLHLLNPRKSYVVSLNDVRHLNAKALGILDHPSVFHNLCKCIYGAWPPVILETHERIYQGIPSLILMRNRPPFRAIKD